MTRDHWQRIKAIYEEADDTPPDARCALLDCRCGDDVDLRQRVERLLGESDDGAFIGEAIAEHAATLGLLAGEERFGHYRIVRRIGQGGMGAVYEAVRVDDFEKRVALKVIQQEFDSAFARSRFQQERQLLATLEHPYIARLFDGGETNDGSPYLVLEFVEGERIDRYCEKLDAASRLRLFQKVCEAVEHAHRNLVIHRDLKPANILVTHDGIPKLLDFGIAKLVDPSAARTQTGFSAFTPDYASPEQVRGLAVHTASDVYSLGVILYELLTGRKPYSIDGKSALAVERAVCEQPPDAPGLGDELDHILSMSLRKEPERRYREARANSR